ncbi:hypothetical protein GGI12_000226 [Dipsacomyces acuminosporus]|nr:hypothetical protein GGI12_000226 [Dipsacomyces acuminosporus]
MELTGLTAEPHEQEASHTDGDDSDPDYEYSTHRPGAATPYDSVHQEQKHTCFICSKVLSGDSNEINAHIDRCLSGTSDTNVGDATPADPGPMIEYEWGGQRRIRATAILEGGLRAAGLGYGSSATAGKDEDIDVDVDAEDEISFGASQYTDKDLIITSESAGSSSSQHNQHMPQYEETAPALDPEPSSPAAHAVARSEGASAVQTPSAIPASSSSSQLIIDALKERIRQQDRLLQAAHKCLVCLEPYVKPCTSINCWHVYCEKCWLQTLGTKKLCPQCNQITQPTDIRRVYL